MSIFRFRIACALALAAATAGCVVAGADAPSQQLEVHTILGHREVVGVGCVLSNSAGRWFVVAPGRVTVERTRDPLTIDCAREGVGSAREQAASHNAGLFDTDKLIGNVVITAGMEGYINRQAGEGVAYPSTLTILLRAAGGRPGDPDAAPVPGDVVF
ncbi:hypothetical protein [Herbaspirillum sp. SJZ107]|uniref:hypothetical protein n=1 Tax=Herbaspirillum sp. SJZ107 TaxID=2572881 RepID=UPI00115178F5|nr:hypothetical protein [Herbaspirillum sp. SJZ107]TQK10599.1 hypothetical protein FBX97_0518 [Herbaspirillum sp. SJZ107]